MRRALQEEERIAREAKEADEKTMSKKPGKSHGFVTFFFFFVTFYIFFIFAFRLRTVAGETRVVAKMWD